MNRYRELIFLKELNGVGPARINKVYVPLLLNGIELDSLISFIRDNEVKADENNIQEALSKSDTMVKVLGSRSDIGIITILDAEYPSKLRVLENNAPIILYTKGDISLMEKPSISVIGTRTPSAWSSKVEIQLVNKVIEFSNRVIVSGLALGCDTVAHKSCVANGGLTIAVLPCGFDHISPEENIGLSEDIIKNGGLLISEYPPEVEATRYTFVNRDTLIAAISDAIFVMECGKDSGTMHTVNAGYKIKRKIAAFCTTLKDNGNFEGNDYIIDEKIGVPVTDNESLRLFLDDIGTVVTKEQPTQMSLFDFMGK